MDAMVKRTVPTSSVRKTKDEKADYSKSVSSPSGSAPPAMLSAPSASKKSGGCCGNDYHKDDNPRQFEPSVPKLAPISQTGRASVQITRSTFAASMTSTLGASFIMCPIKIGDKVVKAQVLVIGDSL